MRIDEHGRPGPCVIGPPGEVGPAGACVFCDIVNRKAPARVVENWKTVLTIIPLSPVTEGHLLVIPKRHVRDAAEDATLTGNVFAMASIVASKLKSYNLITSVGTAATQTVFHFHVHVVPRRPGDGLMLPWRARRRAWYPDDDDYPDQEL